MKSHSIFLQLWLLLLTALPAAASSFVTVSDGRLMRHGVPYRYIGTNFWYGAILGSEGQGGNRQRLCEELDRMKRMGIDNLRILVGADGQRGGRYKVEPTLQESPGVYNDTLLAGLDYLLMEMGRRDMLAVLYLNNSWEWSGGYSYYLEQVGAGRVPLPNVEGYEQYVRYAAQYAANERAHRLFEDYVRFILGRTNRYTGLPYTEEPTIMAWQICNEPRAFSREGLPAMRSWLSEVAALIRRMDARHLISTGSEGAVGCEGDYDCYEAICTDPNIDYCTIHVWPYNWGWSKADRLSDDLPRACSKTKEYIDRHLQICRRTGKPLVMEEFGYPRDGFVFTTTSPTRARDAYYRYVFSLVGTDPLFAGCNFWGWGGAVVPRHEWWQVGDEYTADPAQEQQGLYSVFASDRSTLKVIRDAIRRLPKRRP